jgi:hypothetical protein
MDPSMNTQQLRVIAASMEAVAAAAAGGQLVAATVMLSNKRKDPNPNPTVNCREPIDGSFDMIKLLPVLTEIILVMLHCLVSSSS